MAGLAFAFVSAGCFAASDDHLTRIENRLTKAKSTYDAIDLNLEECRRLSRSVATRTASARRDWLAAERAYTRASEVDTSAATEYLTAADDYAATSAAYRRVATILIVAAAWDLFLNGVCGPRVSTQQYREQLRDAGVDLDGIDVDHKFPKSLGGPDRPWNYQLLESSLNRSLGADLLAKFWHMPLSTLDALAKTASYQLLCPE